MNYVQFDEIGITVAVIAAAMGFLVLTWNAIKAVRDWRTMTKQPTSDKIEDHERRIVHLEKCCEDVHGKLENDWQFQRDETEINKLMLRSIKHLIQHEVDGNDRMALQQMEAEIDNWLFDHAK